MVTVCSENVLMQGPSVGAAYATAAGMFARIGVKLEWRGRSRCPSGALHISLSMRTPESLRPGALAYAFPYERMHIVVYFDRVKSAVESDRSATILLAHVFVHEITHILQGDERHSASGVMKAKWDNDDFRSMFARPLPFTSEDVDCINQGMIYRGTLPASR
jgi:hypothetical protein